jgi:hypothetical protein
MANPALLTFAGVLMIALGLAYLRKPEWIRKYLYRSALIPESWTRWLYSKFVSEDTLVHIVRFTVGPALIAAGCLLFTTGLRNV